MREVRAVVLQIFQELANRCLHLLGPAVALRHVSQALEVAGQVLSVGQLQGPANEPVDLFAHRAAAERVAYAVSLRLQLQEQMEMTQLQHPLALMGEPPHSGEIIDDHGLNSASSVRWNRRQGLLPARSALLPREQ